jgi:Domain of unknown function (DUF4279)
MSEIIEMTQNKRETFSAGASFRIFGVGLDLDAVTRELGQQPNYTHKQGVPDIHKRIHPHDMWSLASPLGDGQELELHLNWLAERLLPSKQYILSLGKQFKVNFYCWKNCYTEQASLILSSQCLRIFTELSIPLDVSLICGPNESEQTKTD